jgi:hypothetical protein
MGVCPGGVVSPELLANKEFMTTVIKQSGRCLEYLPSELKNDRGLVLEAVKSDGYAYRFLKDDNELRSDPEIAIEAMKASPQYFGWLPKSLRDDRAFVLRALKEVGSGIGFSFFNINNDPVLPLDIIVECIKLNPNIVNHFPHYSPDYKGMVLGREKKI